jgi:hypothetical protein
MPAVRWRIVFWYSLGICQPDRNRVDVTKNPAHEELLVKRRALVAFELLNPDLDVVIAWGTAGGPAHILRTAGTGLGSTAGQPYIDQIDTRLCPLSEPVGRPVNRSDIAVSQTNTLLLCRYSRRIGTILFIVGTEVGFEVTPDSFDAGILVAATQVNMTGAELEHVA